MSNLDNAGSTHSQQQADAQNIPTQAIPGAHGGTNGQQLNQLGISSGGGIAAEPSYNRPDLDFRDWSQPEVRRGASDQSFVVHYNQHTYARIPEALVGQYAVWLPIINDTLIATDHPQANAVGVIRAEEKLRRVKLNVKSKIEVRQKDLFDGLMEIMEANNDLLQARYEIISPVLTEAIIRLHDIDQKLFNIETKGTMERQRLQVELDAASTQVKRAHDTFKTIEAKQKSFDSNLRRLVNEDLAELIDDNQSLEERVGRLESSEKIHTEMLVTNDTNFAILDNHLRGVQQALHMEPPSENILRQNFRGTAALNWTMSEDQSFSFSRGSATNNRPVVEDVAEEPRSTSRSHSPIATRPPSVASAFPESSRTQNQIEPRQQVDPANQTSTTQTVNDLLAGGRQINTTVMLPNVTEGIYRNPRTQAKTINGSSNFQQPPTNPTGARPKTTANTRPQQPIQNQANQHQGQQQQPRTQPQQGHTNPDPLQAITQAFSNFSLTMQNQRKMNYRLKMAKYNGDTNFKHWMAFAKRKLRTASVPVSDWINQITDLLEGEAFVKASMLITENEFMQFDEFEDRLLQVLHGKCSQNKAYVDQALVKQYPNESVKDYLKRKFKALEACDAPQEEQTRQILIGARPEIAQGLTTILRDRSINYANVGSELEQIETLFSNALKYQKNPPNAKSKTAAATTGGTSARPVRTGTQQASRGNFRSTPRQQFTKSGTASGNQTQQPKNPICFNCKKPGHYSKDCKAPAASPKVVKMIENEDGEFEENQDEEVDQQEEYFQPEEDELQQEEEEPLLDLNTFD